MRKSASDPFAVASGGPGETPPADPGEPEAGAAVMLPAPVLDPADYLPDMAGLDITEAQKIELLEALWSILQMLLDSGIDIADADPCGQVLGAAEDAPIPLANGVSLPLTQTTNTEAPSPVPDRKETP